MLAMDKILDIWDKQTGYWSDRSNPDSVGNWLGWLTLPFEMEEAAKTAEAFAEQKIAEGITDIVVIGMGGSSLCSLPIMSYYGREDARVNLHIVDLVHPETIRQVKEKVDYNKTLFIVITKSVTTAETLSLSKFFYNDLKDKVDNPVKHFVLITDPNKDAKLKELKKYIDYEKWFEIKADVGGRYSVLTNVGILPAAFIKKGAAVDMIKGAMKSAQKCKSDDVKINQGLRLGIEFDKNRVKGRDKLVIVLPKELSSYGFWFEQLIFESLGKQDKSGKNTAIVPVFDEEIENPQYYGDDVQFLYVQLETAIEQNADKIQLIKDSGIPVIEYTILKDEGLGGLFYTSEFAVAVSGFLMNLNTFNQPGVQLSKDKTYEYLIMTLDDINNPSKYIVNEKDILLDYGSIISNDKLNVQEIEDVLTKTDKKDISAYYAVIIYLSMQRGKKYAPLLPYAYEENRLSDIWNKWRKNIRIITKMSTMLGIGPRFQHSTGQGILQGKNDNFITFIRQLSYEFNPKVPGEDYTFGKLINAQQKGNEDTFADNGRFAVRFDIKDFSAENVEKLNNVFEKSFIVLKQLLG